MFNENEEENLKMFILIGTNILFAFVLFVLALALLFTAKKRKLLRENLTIAAFYQQEILKTQLEIKEQALKNISHEIHDNIGQVLSLTKMHLFTFNPENRDQLLAKVEDAKILVSKAIYDLRSLSNSMNTDYVEQLGLVRAVESELERVSRSGVIKAYLQIKGKVGKLDRQRELVIFRIFQEALTNIVKHASASVVTVVFDFESDLVCLLVSDDGKGFDIDAMDFSTVGRMKSMQSRAVLIGATFTVNSRLENGTQIKLMFPANFQK